MLLIRSASLTNFPELARAHHLDPSRLLAEVGLPPGCLRNPDLKVPAFLVSELLELASRRSGLDTFGLQMAETRQLSNLGALALVLREVPSLRRALDALARFGRLHNEALLLVIEEAGDVAVIREELVAGPGAAVRQSVELVLGVTFRLLKVILGAQWRPLRVCFAHAAPAKRDVHLRIFGRGVTQFGCDFNGIVCAASDLDAPNLGADPVSARSGRLVFEAELQSGRATMTHDVRRLVFMLLPAGHCRVELVAQHLGVDRRTVHRQLRREGETFSAIVNAARCELAPRYLQDTSRPLEDVAGLLGFSAGSALSRWYLQRFGRSPSQYRVEKTVAQ